MPSTFSEQRFILQRENKQLFGTCEMWLDVFVTSSKVEEGEVGPLS